MTPPMTLISPLVSVAVISGLIPGDQAHPCRAAPDTATHVLYDIKQMLESNGLDTNGVSIVRDSSTCQAVINSYNAASDSTLRVHSGYVVHFDSTFALYLPPAAGTPYKTEEVVLFNKAFQLLIRMAGLN